MIFLLFVDFFVVCFWFILLCLFLLLCFVYHLTFFISTFFFIFFFKQKTEYELRISDGSSDVCSSDLNCLAPVAFVLDAAIGIEKGYMTTIHAYTGDQPTLDTMHKDLYRGRAAALSMIPTTTGAAKAVGLVLPSLKGKLDGSSIRVPTPNVSLIDFKFVAKKNTTVEEVNEEVNEAMKRAAGNQLKGILAINDAPLVSSDFNHNPASPTFDLKQTQVKIGNLVRVLSWYDNEWGFSNRMADTAVAMAKL